MTPDDRNEELQQEAPLPSRRDLRERSTGRSRRASSRAAAVRRAALDAPPKQGGRRSSAPRKPKKPSLGKRIAKGSMAVLALSFAAGLLLATSLPATLFAPAPADATTASAAKKSSQTTVVVATGQTLTDASSASPKVSRDSFSVLSAPEVTFSYTAKTTTYTVDNSGKVRWPFPVAVPLGDLYGPRAAPCAGCSTFHHGIDFQPGVGAPIYAIADGVVSQVDAADPSLGNDVYITHEIDGVKVTSLYAHMETGSSPMKLGAKVKEGDLVGLVGSTGESSGPHLHFGIFLGGPNENGIDPLPWMIAHTKH
jgi:murein DD-endopeptidase MepM/ murein hydrolase activator NlpD